MFRLVERRRYYFIFSAIIISLGIVAMIISTVRTGRPFQIGVDFQSGTRYEVQFTEPVTESELRDLFIRFGSNNPSVTSLQGEGLENAWQIRTEFVPLETSRAVLDALAAELAPLVPGSTLVETVSPSVGAEVTRAAFVAIIVAAVIILFYIMFSFRQVPHPFRYGAAAVAAMLHDLAITFGFISITGLAFGWEVDALFLTAVLTVAGFSLQDTIVVFDRIRENIRKRPLEDFELLANRSILETIHRSLATQLNAMFVMVAILLFGGASIKHFIAVLLVGLLSGTYSSIFNAVPLLVAWEKRALETA
ncbi:MAG: protein translocase subunit SecF [Anaerolineae bacterium]|nr:protein translocase subunit SecF [Anaerolineae bacterium]